MALLKTIALPNSTTGNYVRLAFFRCDFVAREVSAHFVLYASAAARISNSTEHLGIVAKLRLEGAKFDQYFSTAGVDQAAALYIAAKVEPLIAGGGLTELDLKLATNV